MARTRQLRMQDVKLGDILIADGGFTCIKEGKECEVKQDRGDGRLYVDCWGPEGNTPERHYLEGQEDEHGYLVGLTMKSV